MNAIFPSSRARYTILAAAFGALLATGCGPTYPNCDNDENCHEGEFCVNGQCQMCRDDNDCPAGQSCNDGRCDPIPGYCDGDGDCPSGQECQNNRCVAAQVSELPPPPEEPPPPVECQLQAVYFGFDVDDLDSGSRDTIQANARCMQERGITSVHLTGHTDPRGTEEYNLALGDRRAQAVKRYLGSLGINRGSIGASSQGEEMSRGTSEGSWSQDRRVAFTQR